MELPLSVAGVRIVMITETKRGRGRVEKCAEIRSASPLIRDETNNARLPNFYFPNERDTSMNLPLFRRYDYTKSSIIKFSKERLMNIKIIPFL